MLQVAGLLIMGVAVVMILLRRRCYEWGRRIGPQALAHVGLEAQDGYWKAMPVAYWTVIGGWFFMGLLFALLG